MPDFAALAQSVEHLIRKKWGIRRIFWLSKVLEGSWLRVVGFVVGKVR